MRIAAAVSTDKGRIRENNEDCYFLNGKVMDESGIENHITENAQTNANIALYAVCDGMGGAMHGEVASRIAATGLQNALYEAADGLQSTIGSINQSIFDEIRGTGGTTLTGVQLNSNKYRTVNIGDSRTYLLRAGVLTQITKDHSEVQQLLDIGILTPETVKTYKRRNVITRSLGTDPEEENVVADISEWKELQDDDCFLILSDGVSGSLTNDEMTVIVSENTPDVAAELLTSKAMEAGSKDNVTAIVVKVQTEESADSVKSPSVTQMGTPELPRNEYKDVETTINVKKAVKPGRNILIGIAVICVIALGVAFIPHWHHGVEVPEIPATCTEAGTKAGVRCKDCDAVLNGCEEIPALGHTPETDACIEATCTATGISEGSHCAACGMILTAQETIPMKLHQPASTIIKEPTCTDVGVEQVICIACQTVLDNRVIPAKEHTYETVAGREATCTETGLTEGERCTVCGYWGTAQEVVEKKQHIEVIISGKSATCTETGMTDGKKCSVCGMILKEQKEIAALGHTPELIPEIMPTATECGWTAGSKCSVCGEILEYPQERTMFTTMYRYRDAVWSEWSDWSVDREPIDDKLKQERSRTTYRWWGAECLNCGVHNPNCGTGYFCVGCNTEMTAPNTKEVYVWDEANKGRTLRGRDNGRLIEGKLYWHDEDEESSRIEYSYRFRGENEWTEWSEWMEFMPEEKTGERQIEQSTR